jgi:hypothetical protein
MGEYLKRKGRDPERAKSRKTAAAEFEKLETSFSFLEPKLVMQEERVFHSFISP